jgi:hypothetical protein
VLPDDATWHTVRPRFGGALQAATLTAIVIYFFESSPTAVQ